MATTLNNTTIHGSQFISTSEVFCCRFCSAPVAAVVLPGGELAYECSAKGCGHTVHVDCVEALAVRDELAIELPALAPAECAEWAVSEAMNALNQVETALSAIDPDRSFDAVLAAAAARTALAALQTELSRLMSPAPSDAALLELPARRSLVEVA